MSAQDRILFAKLAFPSGSTVGNPAEARSPQRGTFSRDLKRFLSGFLLVVFCVAIAWPLLPRRYESTAAVILRPTDDQGRLDSVQSLRQPLDDNAIQSEMDIIGSPTIASAVIAQHHLENDPEFAGDPNRIGARLLGALYRVAPITALWFGQIGNVSEAEVREQLQKHLTVSRDRRSYTVKMGYWSSDPAKAAAMTDTLLNVYLSNQLARKHSSAEQNSAWLIERVEELRGKYENSERAIRDFTTQSDLIDNTMLGSLETQQNALSQEAADLRSKISAATMQFDLSALQGGKAASTGFTPAELSPKLRSADIRNWELREAIVQKTMRTIREEIADRRLAMLKLEALRREAAIDKELLEGALVRLKQQETQASSVGPGVEIISRADPALRPSFPNALLFLAGTLVAAFAAGSAMVWNPRPNSSRPSDH